MYSANRRVYVVSTERDGDRVSVYYRQVAGANNEPVGTLYRSKYDRFQRAFDLTLERLR